MTGQAGQGTVASRAVVALAGLLAVVLLTAVGVAAFRTTSVAGADTVLVEGADAVLSLPDGARRAAQVGERVPRGATVRAGTTAVVLETRERRVHLGQATAVTVVDGARQVLREGYAMVDASRGPGVEMTTGSAVVTTADASLVRVVGGPIVRVGVLRGDAAAVRAAGRRASSRVPVYYQAQVAGGLPTDATPLLLTGDAFERELARELFDADRDLNALARRLDTDGDAGPAVLQVLSTVVPAATTVAGAPESERALGFLLAAAVDAQRAGDRYAEVRALRTAGGSWGVVAAIVGATPDQVSAALGALLAPDAAPALAAGGDPQVAADLLSALLAPPATGPGPAAPQPSAGPSAPAGPTPGPSPSPSPQPSRPGTGVAVVDEVVDTVLDLVDPSPSGPPLLPDRPLLPLPTSTPLLDLSLLD